IFILIGKYVPLQWIKRVIPIREVAEMVRVGVMISLVTLIISSRNLLAQFLVKRAWQKGNYDRALSRIRMLSFGRPSALMIEMEGITHGLANCPAQAEECYRAALARALAGARSQRIRMLGCLAEAMSDQGRNEESQQCRQNAIEMGDTKVGTVRAGLATLLLKQGTEPQRALDLLDEAMRIAKGPAAAKVMPMRLADRAWALALLGRRQEAEATIEQALRALHGSPRLFVASTHLSIGMALVAMERTQKAIEHFRAARDADPQGKCGARALNQIKQHSVWGQ
ncbi:MAG: tetratricopeptide repeat protein, partial [Bryobacteraceae bacterium]